MNRFLLLSGLLSLSVAAYAQTNLFPLYSYGTYSGGSGDMTNVSSPHLKLQAFSGYVRVSHISAVAGISAVYNFETGKDVYWGEYTDVGNYWFRGRNLLMQGGKIGINVVSPQYVLDAAGQVGCNGLELTNKYPGSSTTDLGVTTFFNASAYDFISVHHAWDSNAVFIAGYNASNAAASGWTALATQHVYIGTPGFGTNNYIFFNLTNGSLGIGTNNTQGYQLAVNGSAIFTAARIRAYANWPDFVFRKDYQLPSLDSVEQYIQRNHHLPELPSADSVQAAGIDLGVTDAALLRKIEELTLYVIEQKKLLEAQQAMITRLEQRMDKNPKN